MRFELTYRAVAAPCLTSWLPMHIGGEGETWTHMIFYYQRILSPSCLPIPSQPHLWQALKDSNSHDWVWSSACYHYIKNSVLEQVEGVEPSSSVWRTEALAVEQYLHIRTTLTKFLSCFTVRDLALIYQKVSHKFLNKRLVPEPNIGGREEIWTPTPLSSSF